MPVAVKGGIELRKALKKFTPDLAKETQKEMGALLKPIGAVTSAVSGASAGVDAIGSLSKYLLPIAGLALAYFAFMAYAPRRRK